MAPRKETFFVVEPCTTANGFEIKFKNKKIDLVKAAKAISSIGEMLASSPVVLLAKMKGYSLSIYASGRIMIKSNKKMYEKEARELANEIVMTFEKTEAIL